MEQHTRVVWVLAASLAGGALALIGAPAPLPELAPEAVRQEFVVDLPVARERVPVAPGDAPPPAAPESRVSVRAERPELLRLPPSVSLCLSPTAKRLVGPRACAVLAAAGTFVSTHLESNLGAAGRVARGADDLALVAGEPLATELPRGVVGKILGYHVLVPVVHPDHDVHDLTSQTLHQALVGSASRWSHVGSARPSPIAIVAVEESPFSDQASALVMLGDRLVPGARRLADDDAVAAFVATDRDALGLCSLSAARRAGVRVLSVNGVAPSAAAHVAGLYPFATPIRVLARDASKLDWLDGLAGGEELTAAPPR